MKALILLLIAIPGVLGTPAFAEDVADNTTEAMSVDRETGCKTGYCSAPVLQKQASVVDQKRSKELVDWIMNGGSGTPPALTSSETAH